jgi:HK97 family phage prohead protease
MTLYATKSFAIQGKVVKDVDMNKRLVSGYFSAFDVRDSDGDIIVKGAYTKTISENKRRIKHLFNHNRDLLIGKIQELNEDDYGLFFVSKMSETDDGKRALIRYQEEIIDEHSVGFDIMREDYDQTRKANIIKEIMLYEGSAVTWGANEMTPVIGIKSNEISLVKLYNRFEKIEKILRTYDLSEANGKQLQKELIAVKALLTTQQEKSKPINSPALEVAPDELKNIFRQNLTFKTNGINKGYFND